jgi:hypothetical protein
VRPCVPVRPCPDYWRTTVIVAIPCLLGFFPCLSLHGYLGNAKVWLTALGVAQRWQAMATGVRYCYLVS